MMKNLYKVPLITLFFALLFRVDPVFAKIGSTEKKLNNMFTGWLENLLIAIIALAGIVAVAVLVFNAFLYITASGDESKVQKATKGITYAIVGLIIAAIAFMIVNFVIGEIA